MRRVLIIAAIVIAGLVLLGLAAVQIVLWTDLPRRMVVEQLEKQSGLDVDAARLRTGWGGDTALRGVTVALPLADDPFLVMPELELSHTALLQLLLGQPLEVGTLRLERPTLVMRLDEQGEWDLVRAAQIVQRTQQAREAGESAGADGGMNLPEITVRDGTLRVVRPEQTDLEYGDLFLHGVQGDAGQTWGFELELGPYASAEGRLVPQPIAQHEVRFQLQRIAEVLEPWVGDVPAPISVAGRWSGRVSDGAVRGRLQLERAEAGDLSAEGGVVVRTGEGGAITIEPQELTLRWSDGGGPVRLTGGAVRTAGELVTLERLRVEGFGAAATLDGRWDRAAGTAALRGAWSGDLAALGAVHQGRLDLSATLPGPGPLGAEARVSFGATTEAGELSVRAAADVEGTGWQDLTLALRLPTARWQDGQGTVDLSGAAVQLGLEQSLLTLERLDLPQAQQARATGRYDLRSGAWSIDLDASELALPRLAGEPVDVAVQASGDQRAVRFPVATISSERLSLSAEGSWSASVEPHLQAQANVTLIDPFEGRAAATAPREGAPGRLHAAVDVQGSMTPLDLRWQGELTAAQLGVAAGVLEQVSIPWHGRLGEEHVSFGSEGFDLLGGRWSLHGSFGAQQPLTATLSGDAVPLERLIELLGAPLDTTGLLHANVELVMPELDPQQLAVQGDWSVSEVRGRGFAAERGAGRFDVKEGTLHLRDARLERGDGTIEGTAQFNVNRRERLWIDLVARHWPVQVEGTPASAAIDGSTRLSIDVAEGTAQGRITATADLALRGDPLGAVQVDGTVEGRTLQLSTINGDVGGGTFEGSGTIPLEQWWTSTGELIWRNLDLAELAPFAGVEGLTGTSSGTVTAGAATQQRAPGPLAISVNASVENGRYNGMTISGAEALIYGGSERWLLDRSTIRLAGGTIQAWGRSSLHAGQRQGHISLTLSSLDLDELVHGFDPDAEPVPGRLDGGASVGGYIEQPHRMFGSGRLTISQSDLGSVPVFDLLYNVLNLDFGGDPRGRGEVRFALEGDALEITKLEYFNRGAEIAMTATVENLGQGMESPINGLAVGAVRPFAEFDLPLVGELDRLVAALQSGAATVRIGGTLGERELQVVPFAEVSSSIQRLFRATFQ